MKQTAVEFSLKILESYGDPVYCKLEWQTLDSLIQQAKEKEKEQIEASYADGYSEGYKRALELVKWNIDNKLKSE